MLTRCTCGHLVRRHGPTGCAAEGCGCQTTHDRLAKRLNRRIDPYRVSAVWCHEEGDLTCHAVPVAGDRRGTPPPRTPAVCNPSATWGRWRRPYQLVPLSTLRCPLCLQALPRWTERMATEAPLTTITRTSQATAPVAMAVDPRYPTRVLVAVHADPRRADLTERDYQEAARRWSG